jgi:hypothetical protein
MRMIDAVTLIDRARLTSEGYLEANARTARTGVQQYYGFELDRPDLDVVNVYRDEAEVFSKRSLDTFARIPITVDHPAEPVTAANWKAVAAGTSGDEVLRDGEFMRIGLKITDAAAVKIVQDGWRGLDGGRCQISMGYSADLVWEDGVAPDGTPYQARQTGISANHIAIVARGRAGPSVRIGDAAASSWGASPITIDHEGKRMTTRAVMVDGLSVETTDQAAVAIDKLLTERKEARDSLAAAMEAHAAAMAKKDEEIGALKADLMSARDAAPKAADLDRMVAERAALVTTARAIDAHVAVDGRSDADIRRAVVAGKLGDGFKDAPDAEIAGAFKALTKDVKPADPVAGIIAGGVKPAAGSSTVADAHADYVARMTGAWSNQTEGRAA